MKRIHLWFGLLLLALVRAVSADAVEKPNVVVIMVDDLGYADMAFLPYAPNDVNAYGTPGFDQLAKTGTFFQTAYSTSAICSPARVGFITGRYQQRWGNYWYNEGGLPQEELTIPEALSELGYVTAKLGKTHLNGGPKEFPTLHGFDYFLGFMHHTWDYIRLSQKDVNAYRSREGFKGFANQIIGPLLKSETRGENRHDAESVSYEDGFSTEIFTDEAVNFIKKDKQGRPFYLHISHNAVHQPTYVVEESWAKKTGARYVPWDRDAERWEYPYWDPDVEPNMDFHKRWGHMGELDVDGRRCYLANLLALDHSVSQVLAALEESGQRDNTIIIFLSDNGGTINTYADNGPLRGYKYNFGEGGIRIPILISMPGRLPQGNVVDKVIVSSMDIFPTLLELIGEPVKDNFDGKSLLPVLEGGEVKHHESLVWAENHDRWTLRKGKWKLAHNIGWGKRIGYEIAPNGDVVPGDPFRYPHGVLLFNLDEDPGEQHNVIDQFPEVAEELFSLHESWNSQMSDPVSMKNK